MTKRLLLILCLALTQAAASAQHTADAAYAKFMQLTGMFRGNSPYSCLAIVEVKYNDASAAIRDTSKLTYKNGLTYYKSGLIEHVEASEGELIINHELKTAVFNISDSIKQVLQKELNVQRNREIEALLDSNFESRDQADFKRYVVQHCNVAWTPHGDYEEISFTPKISKSELFLSMKIRFAKNSRVLYYEYANKEAYAKDMSGRTKYRIVKTIYDGFAYDNVANIPAKLSDFLGWSGWTIKLKKHTNYKLSLL